MLLQSFCHEQAILAMGNKESVEPEPLPRNPSNLTKICVAGYSISPNYTRAVNVGFSLAQQFPDQYEFWHYGPGRTKVSHL